jgi:hypothetical protein
MLSIPTFLRSRDTRTLGLLFALACATALPSGPAQALILNGDFENNSAIVATNYNVPNAIMNGLLSDITAWGSASEIDLIEDLAFGLAPQSGNWKIGMNSQEDSPYDALSFAL